MSICGKSQELQGVSANIRQYAKDSYDRSIDERLSTIFVSIGIPPHIKGYLFLRDGIKLVVDDPLIINSITRRLYPAIAKKYDTSETVSFINGILGSIVREG